MDAVSIWALGGRLKIPFVCGEPQRRLLATQKGEADLVYRGGNFYLNATCEATEPPASIAAEYLGVDLGVVNIASDSEGKWYSGSTVKSVRHRHRRLRRKLQKKQTRAAKRRLKRLAGKEARFARHTNHVISKEIVACAEGTRRGIKLEELGGIRGRMTVGRKQRAVLHSWAFFQLRMFIAYKAALAGVPVVYVDPRNTSRECAECGHVAKENRPNQATFRCVACQHAKPVLTEMIATLSKYDDVRVVMVTGERLAADETKFAAALGLSAGAVIRMDLDPLRLRVVPTTVLVDSHGAVLYSTEGEVSADDRAAVLRLAGTAAVR